MSLPLVPSEDVIEGKLKEQRIFFDDDSLKLMKYIVQRSYKQEYGATLCTDKSQDSPIHLRYIIKGTKEGIEHELRCKDNERIVGNFHTHPNQKKIYPSARDYHNMKHHSISCIGSNKAKPKIECYVKMYMKEEEENERDIIINRLLELETFAKSKKTILRFKKEHNMLEDTLLNKYLKRFDPEENPYITRTYIDKK